MERYFVEPYRFVPPHRGTLWCALARRLMPWHLRRNLGVHCWRFAGQDHLREAAARQAGVLLVANHNSWCDPMVLGVMASQVKQYLYYLASYHLFRQSKVKGWILNRIGGYSIWREGTDRESIRETVRILSEAERPVAIFPEGTWFRQNDRVGPFQEGLSLIARQAVKQSQRPIAVIPVGIKYWVLGDPRATIAARLATLEERLQWTPQGQLGLVERFEKLGNALLALEEVELLNQAQAGPLDERIAALVGGQVERLETQHLGKRHQGWVLERIRRLRQHLTRKLQAGEGDLVAIKKDLEDMLHYENLNAHSMEYLREDPSAERLVESWLKIEETIFDDIEVTVVPMGVTIRFGTPIDARALPDEMRGEAFTARLRADVQSLVDAERRQGPPAEWGCPTLPRTPV